MERGDKPDFTTNHIARRAGFSIGTLYRYFPHKKAILREMVEAALSKQETRFRDALVQSEGATPEELIEAVVQTMLEPFRSGSRIRKSMLFALIQDAELMAEVNTAHLQMMRAFQARLVDIDPARFCAPSDLSCLTLTGALLGSIRMTMFIDSATLSDPDYHRELIAMVTYFVTAKD